jgi:hypothetical protein
MKGDEERRRDSTANPPSAKPGRDCLSNRLRRRVTFSQIHHEQQDTIYTAVCKKVNKSCIRRQPLNGIQESIILICKCA